MRKIAKFTFAIFFICIGAVIIFGSMKLWFAGAFAHNTVSRIIALVLFGIVPFGAGIFLLFPNKKNNNSSLLADEKLIKAYVFENENYYVSKFNELKNGKGFIGFNIPALFFLAPWLAYRRLYAYAIFYSIFEFCLAVVIGVCMLKGSTMSPHYNYVIWPIIFVIRVIVSAHITEVYLVRANSKIMALSATINDDVALVEAVQKAGGTSNNACFFVILISLTINLLLPYAKFT